jgi:hypothetical protein
MLKLYHYSKADIKEKLKISFYGDNYYTKNDCNITSIKRLFFYTEPKQETLLRDCQYLYISYIQEYLIYDLDKDIIGYKNKYKTITDILKAIIKKGFKGVSYSIGNKIINLFYDIKFKQKLKLY